MFKFPFSIIFTSGLFQCFDRSYIGGLFVGSEYKRRLEVKRLVRAPGHLSIITRVGRTLAAFRSIIPGLSTCVQGYPGTAGGGNVVSFVHVVLLIIYIVTIKPFTSSMTYYFH